VSRTGILAALAAALCLGACATKVDTSIVPHVELDVGAAAAPVALPPATIVRRDVLVVPQVPKSCGGRCKPAAATE
jgi:hypothetical protein